MDADRDADAPPSGFVRFSVGRADVVCAANVADGVRAALSVGSLFRYAERHPETRPLAGRGIAYAVPLARSEERIVVRHNRHGGLFAPLTRDLFRLPTRAPHELWTSESLRSAGVSTPAMLGYVTYRVVPGVVRADVFSREIQDGFDLSAILIAPQPTDVAQAWSATHRLVRALAKAGARHRDLNVKNILLERTRVGGLDAYVLDVDRVEFVPDRDAANEANVARLMRSARKWREVFGAPISDADLSDLEAMLRDTQSTAATRA